MSECDTTYELRIAECPDCMLTSPFVLALVRSTTRFKINSAGPDPPNLPGDVVTPPELPNKVLEMTF